MHTRVSTVTGAAHIDEGIDFLRNEVIPQLTQQKGYRGIIASADRANGNVGVVSFWETKDDLDASESAADKARSEAVAVLGGTAKVERFEQTVSEVGATRPTTGSKLLVRRAKMDPAVLAENVEVFKSTVLPVITGSPGFQAIRQMVDRETGQSIVGTVFADEQARDEALKNFEANSRPLGEARGITFEPAIKRDVLIYEI